MSHPRLPSVVVVPKPPVSARAQSFYNLNGALGSCYEQLRRTLRALQIIDQSLGDELARPLPRRAWALLANQAREAGRQQLSAASQRLQTLSACTSQFQSAINLMTSAEELLDDSTCHVAERSVRLHIEACRDSLVDIGQLVATLQAVPARAVA